MKFKTIDRKVVNTTQTSETMLTIISELDEEGYSVVTVSFYVDPKYPGVLRIAVLGQRKRNQNES